MRKKDFIEEENSEQPINCLTNTKVIVRHINKLRGSITDPKHVLYGGMADRAVRIFTVPRLQSGVYVNVLTNNEKKCLEEALDLEPNSLSVYKKENNFWDNSNSDGVNKVRLTKQDTYLDLSIPEDYIRYKILLANKNIIAPSLQALQDYPKASYQFVLIREDEEVKHTKQALSVTAQCYKEFGKVENDIDTLRLIIETFEGKLLSPNTKLEFLQTKAYEYIQADSKTFLKIITDELLPTKVILRQALDKGIVFKRNEYYYNALDNAPLCESNQESTFNVAARYLSNPKNLQLLFSILAKIKE